MKKPSQEQVFAELHNFQDSKQYKRVDKFIIVHPTKLGYGKVEVSRPADAMGKLKVFVWDLIGTSVQYAYASGCGYNKLNAAMSEIIFDGHQLNEGSEWRYQLEQLGYKVFS